jgi:transcriptional regulator with XRE-family HTH domain
MLIQKLRLQRGWSQQQLADLSGLSVRTIQRLEQGQSASVESLKSLAAVFEIDFSELQRTAMPTHDTPDQASPVTDNSLSTDEALALHHVRKLKGFYIHLAQYVIVIAALFAINLWQGTPRMWAVWPALGWGIGILFHAARVFEVHPFGPDWERRKVEERLGRKI